MFNKFTESLKTPREMIAAAKKQLSSKKEEPQDISDNAVASNSAEHHRMADEKEAVAEKKKAAAAARLNLEHSFLDAARSFDWPVVKQYINETSDLVNVQPSGRLSALHQAAAASNAQIVRYLLEKGANPNATSRDGQTPLDLCTPGVGEECKQMLLNPNLIISAEASGLSNQFGSPSVANAPAMAAVELQQEDDDERPPLQMQQLAMQQQVEENDQILREREAGIAKLNHTVMEVADVFKDLALLVEDQGEHVDKCARSFNKLSSYSCGSSLMFFVCVSLSLLCV